jgi:Asp-tRNA(Asn)/Glu-tRNA(Gln) amidotransferase A subunit family amidase
MKSRNAIDAARRIAEGSLSPVAPVEMCLGRVEARDGEIAAWSYVDGQGARATAHERGGEARSKPLRSPLHVAVAIKGIIKGAATDRNGKAI